ncbi:hypothetical protein BKA61DRAFT_657995 [Leptodontidium sp. MPI-SDFR-AT-0119]|nr:hypothetical protein BKA61DRAFT_657995 [Leptodontidium sp. MPI-SDFR-AT-0119]
MSVEALAKKRRSSFYWKLPGLCLFCTPHDVVGPLAKREKLLQLGCMAMNNGATPAAAPVLTIVSACVCVAVHAAEFLGNDCKPGHVDLDAEERHPQLCYPRRTIPAASSFWLDYIRDILKGR